MGIFFSFVRIGRWGIGRGTRAGTQKVEVPFFLLLVGL